MVGGLGAYTRRSEQECGFLWPGSSEIQANVEMGPINISPSPYTCSQTYYEYIWRFGKSLIKAEFRCII